MYAEGPDAGSASQQPQRASPAALLGGTLDASEAHAPLQQQQQQQARAGRGARQRAKALLAGVAGGPDQSPGLGLGEAGMAAAAARQAYVGGEGGSGNGGADDDDDDDADADDGGDVEEDDGGASEELLVEEEDVEEDDDELEDDAGAVQDVASAGAGVVASTGNNATMLLLPSGSQVRRPPRAALETRSTVAACAPPLCCAVVADRAPARLFGRLRASCCDIHRFASDASALTQRSITLRRTRAVSAPSPIPVSLLTPAPPRLSSHVNAQDVASPFSALPAPFLMGPSGALPTPPPSSALLHPHFSPSPIPAPAGGGALHHHPGGADQQHAHHHHAAAVAAAHHHHHAAQALMVAAHQEYEHLVDSMSVQTFRPEQIQAMISGCPEPMQVRALVYHPQECWWMPLPVGVVVGLVVPSASGLSLVVPARSMAGGYCDCGRRASAHALVVLPGVPRMLPRWRTATCSWAASRACACACGASA